MGFPFCVFPIVEDSVASQLTALITMLLVPDGAIYIPGSRMEKRNKKGQTAGTNCLLKVPRNFHPLFPLDPFGQNSATWLPPAVSQADKY